LAENFIRRRFRSCLKGDISGIAGNSAGISIAIISVVKGLGTKLNTTFSSISSQLK